MSKSPVWLKWIGGIVILTWIILLSIHIWVPGTFSDEVSKMINSGFLLVVLLIVSTQREILGERLEVLTNLMNYLDTMPDGLIPKWRADHPIGKNLKEIEKCPVCGQNPFPGNGNGHPILQIGPYEFIYNPKTKTWKSGGIHVIGCPHCHTRTKFLADSPKELMGDWAIGNVTTDPSVIPWPPMKDENYPKNKE